MTSRLYDCTDQPTPYPGYGQVELSGSISIIQVELGQAWHALRKVSFHSVNNAVIHPDSLTELNSCTPCKRFVTAQVSNFSDQPHNRQLPG